MFSYLSPQCQHEGCSATIFVEDTKFLVCKQQLSHVSEYFRSFSLNEFSIVVSSFTHPPPATQFKWFLESIIQAPVLRDITDDTLETLMRLSKRFRAQGLEMRCVNKKAPMVALCWLNWVLKHKFDKATRNACLPRVATSSLTSLEEHRTMITEKLLADLFAAKLRALYAQAVNVFQTIHTMDHFHVDVDRCPRCGRCFIINNFKHHNLRSLVYLTHLRFCSFQAFYQCPHGLIPLNDRTSDCHCQVSLLAAQLTDLCIDRKDSYKQDDS
ncbi:unnamed protein product [Enterobius vermicularis]|uniref:BTB domain-containing protein n=1 Tax=Enterobius vermicularis TaxID=51028 RepID=A0A0N4UXA4_ENTVE|nr:unnamed protein product [Enterobius vermicularis]